MLIERKAIVNRDTTIVEDRSPAVSIHNGELGLDLDEDYTKPNNRGHYSRKNSEITALIAQRGSSTPEMEIGGDKHVHAWTSAKQRTVACPLLTTTEAKFIFVSEDIELILWVRKPFEELDAA